MKKYSSHALGGSNGPKLLLMLGFSVVALLIIATIATMVLSQIKTGTPTPGSRAPLSSDGCSDLTGKPEATIIYNSSQVFSPECLKVTSGTVITYKNESSDVLEVAADPHPTHTGNREVAKGQFDLEIASGKSDSVTVKKKGTFGLHNHNHPSSTAKVIVE